MYINDRPFLHTPHADTRRYQGELIELLTDIDSVSSETGTIYSLEAGSALGAVRHGGFIPWDNDSDVLMPVTNVKKFLIGLARAGLFEKYELWHNDAGWGWMIKDIYIPSILKDPENYCETSLNWAIARLTYAVFRLVRKETTTIHMSLSKGRNTYPVAHFDTSLSTASLHYKFMLPEEKRTWRRRYLLESEQYKVHPFVDIFPSIEMTPDAYIKMKQGFRVNDTIRKWFGVLSNPGKSLPKTFSRFLPASHTRIAKSTWDVQTFEDYRIGVEIDYAKGIAKAKMAKAAGDSVVVSKAPWNLRKIIPYTRSELYPVSRLKFEGIELNAPNDVVGVLENHYRDFRTPPPEAERIQHAYHVDPNQFEQYVRVNV
jgi:phosphorylcholine metabolism protein LicD